MEKRCPKCKETKPIERFTNDRSRKDGKTACCTACRVAKTMEWAKANPERVKLLDRKRNQTEKRKINQRTTRKNRYNKQKGTYMDFYWRIRSVPYRVINVQRGERYSTPVRYLGCTRDQFIKHIESKFRDGMSWDNYCRVWQIDHIYPYGKIDKRDRDALIKNCHWTNTQPLLIQENMNKGMKIAA